MLSILFTKNRHVFSALESIVSNADYFGIFYRKYTV